MTFDEQWELEERQAVLESLRNERPHWVSSRKRRRTVAASLAVVLVAGISIFAPSISHPNGYDSIACNRSGIAEVHWAAVASDVLTARAL